MGKLFLEATRDGIGMAALFALAWFYLTVAHAMTTTPADVYHGGNDIDDHITITVPMGEEG